MASKVSSCSCVNAQQDQLHGSGQRVFNMKGDAKGWRCTSCGTSKDAESRPKIVAGKK